MLVDYRMADTLAHLQGDICVCTSEAGNYNDPNYSAHCGVVYVACYMAVALTWISTMLIVFVANNICFQVMILLV